MTEYINYAVVYIALQHLGTMPVGRIANYSDFNRLPEDIKPLCYGDGGFAAIDRMKEYLRGRNATATAWK